MNTAIIANPAPRPLGDAIDMVLFCHMYSKVLGTKVALHSKGNAEVTSFANDLIDIGEVSLNSTHKPDEIFYYYPGLAHVTQYIHLTSQIPDIRTQNKIPEVDIDLPENFVTTQWDAGQLYRLVDRWDKDRIKRIEGFYKEQKYDIIDIGNRRFTVREAAYILSKAKYHVGADSGMMHIAKLVKPIESLHVYINIRNRENDKRFPDSWNVAFMARELFRRGAMMNYCENPSKDQIEYFKRTDLYNGLG